MANLPIFSTFSLVAILCFIYADSFMSNFSVQTTYLNANQLLGATQSPKTEAASSSVPVVASLQNIREDYEESDPTIPPSKANTKKRIQWFRQKLPEFKILKSTSLGRRFHGRVLELFDNNCSAQYFMIWLSTARSFGPREFMAVDSLFSVNPKACLLILSRSLDSPIGYNILKPLHDQGFNILAVTPDVPFLVQNTPAEAWLDRLKSGDMDPGSIPLFNHLSDLIRLAVLYKYGGVYLDVDVIFLKDLSGLRNAIGAQSRNPITKKWTRLNGAVMIFDIYHPLLVEFLQEFCTNFDGNRWGHNGPYLVSRVIEKQGNRSEYNLTIFTPKGFYPVDWIKIAKFFKKPETEEELEWVEETVLNISTSSYILHLWNKVTRAMKIEEGSVMERLISTHCVICKNLTIRKEDVSRHNK